jgi:hypothetical protein
MSVTANVTSYVDSNDIIRMGYIVFTIKVGEVCIDAKIKAEDTRPTLWNRFIQGHKACVHSEDESFYIRSDGTIVTFTILSLPGYETIKVQLPLINCKPAIQLIKDVLEMMDVE